MYCRYTTLGTATEAEVLSDIIGVMTGTITNVTQMSASCDQSTTELVTTVAPGWTVHDAAPIANGVVLKAPVYDNPSQYKYVYIQVTNAGHIDYRVFEFWNEVTHVGTNPNCHPTNWPNLPKIRFSLTTPTIIYLSASVRYSFLQTLVGGASGGSLNSITLGNCGLCAEYTRWSPWDTTAAGYPNVVCSPVSAQLSGLRAKAVNGTDWNYTSNNGYGSMQMFNTYSNGVSGSSAIPKIPNAQGVQVMPLIPLLPSRFDGSLVHFGGNVTEQTGLYLTATGQGNFGDEFDVNGTTYVYFGNGTVNSNGGGTCYALCFPKA